MILLTFASYESVSPIGNGSFALREDVDGCGNAASENAATKANKRNPRLSEAVI
jgi:hypothetical protein